MHQSRDACPDESDDGNMNPDEIVSDYGLTCKTTGAAGGFTALSLFPPYRSPGRSSRYRTRGAPDEMGSVTDPGIVAAAGKGGVSSSLPEVRGRTAGFQFAERSGTAAR